MSQEYTVIQFHIPKTGGKTLRHIIARNYHKGEVYTLNAADLVNSVARLKEEVAYISSPPRVVQGHMPFGLHKDFPFPCRYVTMVRDPVERVISSYAHAVRGGTHWSPVVQSHRMTLKEYVLSGINKWTVNGQVRYLATDTLEEWYDQSPFTDPWPALARVKARLDAHFAVVGVFEQYLETLLVLRKMFGWNVHFPQKLNVSDSRPGRDAISQDVRALIVRQNEADIELYQYARKMFRQQLAALVPSLTAELRRFKLSQFAYETVYGGALWGARKFIQALSRQRSRPE
ncbi:MAG: hypothetical protein GF333_01560 [Candidatus Omnitrophica bacterium]|nr:hypothetical protein [Candidatus Omnitrophota bacterium]